MQITTTLSPDELSEGLKLNRTWRYWARLFAANWYMTVLLVVLLCVSAKQIVDGKGINVNQSFMLLVPIGFLTYSYLRQRKYIEKVAVALSDLGGTASLEADGIHSIASTGATSFTPWSLFDGWKEGANVFTIGSKKNFRILPKRGLGQGELDSVRSLFNSNIS